ncbi:MAG: 2-amino-4-hydroxy-6-hydroxymethyldihydropteridine diphosphokinase [Spirochaetia bacterium]|nr:2-amino-4-hydroxy-6-hydroxymethyldihydropteridine diphosphokinase [Spirochaetia bacterium]
MKKVILGLGSNRNYNGLTSLQILSKACTSLSEILSFITLSSVYISKPMYYENQDNFYNMALSGFLDDSILPEVLLEKIHLIEKEFGRNREKEIRNGPRSLDIDIEYIEGLSLNTENLKIPHPKIKERAFVLVPVLEILDKTADEKLMEEFSSYLQNLPDAKDLVKI